MSPFPISHSMADAYASCQKKFEYAHIDKLMPVDTPEALARGTWGHKVLEMFFTRIKDGASVDEAKATALVNAADNPRYFNKLWPRIQHFIDNYYPTLGWEEILDIEHTYRLKLSHAGYEFPFTVDLVVRTTEGITKAVDFKFGADAYSDEMVKLYPQLPKYVGALNVNKSALEYDPPSQAMYVFIRSRSNIANPDLFIEVAEVPLSQQRIMNSFSEQDKASKAIINHMDEGRPYIRAFTNNCKYCSFLSLCIAEVNGKDDEAKTMKEVLYTSNSYGYETEEEMV